MDTTTGLRSVGELFSEAMAITKSKAKVLYAITALNIVIWIPFVLIAGVSVLGGGAAAGTNGFIAGGVVGIVALIAFIILSVRLQIALLEAIMNDYTFGQAFSASKGKIGKFIGTSLLEGIIVILGFILLIVPGIIFAVWYCFASIIVIAEGKSGMDALRQSKSYVTGRWGKVAWRLFVVGILIWIVSVVLQLIGGDVIGPILSNIVTFLAVPFMQVYLYLVYKNFKETKMGTSVVTAPVHEEPAQPV
jgi:hypothetical protein